MSPGLGRAAAYGRTCKSNAIANLLAGGRRRSVYYVYAQLFSLAVYFFLNEARLSPFVLKWTSCHYTPCYCFFFRRFYRVLRREAFDSEKCSFCVRPREFACGVMSTPPIENELWNLFHFSRVHFRLSGFCFKITMYRCKHGLCTQIRSTERRTKVI